MSGLYNDFENRFTGEWFSSGWIEVEAKPVKAIEARVEHKDLATLEFELELIKEHIESLEQRELRLSNLAKMYN